MKKTSPLILIIDNKEPMVVAFKKRLEKQGYNVIFTGNTTTACEMIAEQNQKLDAIVLEQNLPDINGLEIVKWINKNHKIVKPPIIIHADHKKPEQIKECIDTGVFYYLNQPVHGKLFDSVVNSAIKHSVQKKHVMSELKRHENGFKLLDRSLFELRTLDEAEHISCFIANCFPNPTMIMPAIGELVINAVEHGIYGIMYEEKTKLIAEGKWKSEINRRSELDEYKEKKVEVIFIKEGNKYSLRITDQGAGFNWQKYLHADPARALDNHGRGIARANMLFDKLEYNKAGNQVVATTYDLGKDNFHW